MSCRGVLLIGPRGAGKSSVGALLAETLGLPFVDTDLRIEERTGRTIADLLRDGSFREREAEVLEVALGAPPAVIAAGGGAVLWQGLARAARGWWTVWLDADARTLARRIAADRRERPSLTGRPAEVEIGAIAAERSPLYARLAARRVDTTLLDPGQVASILARELAEAPKTRRADSD